MVEIKKSSEDPVEQALEKLKPLLTELSFGSIVGYCSGYAMKKVGKALAFVIGVGFISLQTVVHLGYIDVNWTKVRDDAIIKPLDTTGDGKLDVEDAKAWWRKVKALLTHKVPSAGGFSLGFLYGVRYG